MVSKIQLKKEALLTHLRKNSRQTLTKLSRLTNIPISTVFDLMKDIERDYVFVTKPVPGARYSQKELKLIEMMRFNSRLTVTEMSKRSRIPISTIFDRLAKLEKEHRVQYTAIAKPR